MSAVTCTSATEVASTCVTATEVAATCVTATEVAATCVEAVPVGSLPPIPSDWTPEVLTDPPTGYVVGALRINNSNAIQDDAWQIRANGIDVVLFDGAPSTDVTYYAYLLAGQSIDVTAENATDLSDNYFEVTAYVNGVEEAFVAVTDDPPVGTIIDLFTFST